MEKTFERGFMGNAAKLKEWDRRMKGRKLHQREREEESEGGRVKGRIMVEVRMRRTYGWGSKGKETLD
jgi:hypothetical protein